MRTSKIKKIILIASIFFVGNFNYLGAKSFYQSNIEIHNIWARETSDGMRTAAVYIDRINNTGTKLDSLIKVSSSIAAKHLIHRTLFQNGIAKMTHLKSLEIPINKSVSLKPGGIHIMLLDIKKKLSSGFKFPMILEFKRAGRINVIVEVKKIGISLKKHMDHKQMHEH